MTFQRLLFALLMFIGFYVKPMHAAAAVIDPELLEVRYKDTLYSEGNGILKNNLLLINPTTDTLVISMDVAGAGEWKTLFDPKQKITVLPHGKRVVPLSLVKGSQANEASGLWSQLDIILVPETTGKEGRYPCVIKKEQINRFNVYSDQGEVILEPGEKSRDLLLKIKNEGNASMQYHVEWISRISSTTRRSTVSLAAGKDTTVIFPLQLSRGEQQQIQAGGAVHVYVRDDSANMKYLLYNITSKQQEAKSHVSGFNTIPLTLSMGAMSRVGDITSLFLGIRGQIQFDPDHKLSFNYRSKDFSLQNQYQNHIFSLNYSGKRFNVYAGQVRNFSDFFIQGNELNIALKTGKSGRLSIWGTNAYKNAFSNTYNYTSTAGLNADYSILQLKMQHSFSLAADSLHRADAAIFANRLQILNTKSASLILIGGLGRDILSGPEGYTLSSAMGKSIGYEFSGTYKCFTLTSSLRENNEYFPGVYRGMKAADHSLDVQVSTGTSIGAFYSANSVTNNFGVDTLLNTNRLQFDMERYGLRSTFRSGSAMLRIDLGSYKNTAREDMPAYGYSDVQFQYNDKKRIQINLMSQNGIAPNQASSKEQVWFSNTNLNISVGHFLIGGTYFRYPFYQVQDGIRQLRNTESKSFIAGYKLNIAGCITGNVNYELSKYTLDHFLMHNISGQIAYQGLQNGIIVNLYGSVPLLRDNGENSYYVTSRNFAQLSVSKLLHVPVITRRKYFDFKLCLFIDENGNGIRDDHEPALPQAALRINDRLFVTGNDGKVAWLNTDPGTYTLDLTRAKAPEGMIPAMGYRPVFALQQDMEIDIAYKKGRIVSGKVEMRMDARSSETLSPEGFKIAIKDSSHVMAYALTDADGAFSFSVPAGVYEVCMNKEVFTDKIAPVQLKFNVDVREQERAQVTFVVKQVKREVHFLKK